MSKKVNRNLEVVTENTEDEIREETEDMKEKKDIKGMIIGFGKKAAKPTAIGTAIAVGGYLIFKGVKFAVTHLSGNGYIDTDLDVAQDFEVENPVASDPTPDVAE